MSPELLRAPSSDEEIIEMILAHEGGVYTNHPADRGGPTKWGITQLVLTQWLGRPASIADVQAIDKALATLIYRDRYVKPFDGLVGTLRANVIDMGVNAGVGRAARLLQQCVGVTVDGKVGPQTIAATATRDWNVLYVGFRLAFYEDIILANGSQVVFRRGWRNRALSFFGSARLRRLSPGDEKPVYGFVGKAFEEAA